MNANIMKLQGYVLAVMAGWFTIPTHAEIPKPPAKLCIENECEDTSAPPNTTDFHPTGYTLVFSDEFSGTQLDRGLWCTRYIYGGGPKPQVLDPECQRNGEGTLDFLNDEQQRYVDKNSTGEPMHVVGNGALNLRATRTRSDQNAPFESAMIRSKKLFAPTTSKSYYITAHVNIPNVRGTWGAFWLNSDRQSNGALNWPPEIDIFEAVLNELQDTADMLHMGAQIKGKQTASGAHELTFAAPQLDTKWRNYKANHPLRGTWVEVGLSWTAKSACYFVDGYKVMCENYAWVYNDGSPAPPAHILLNLAIGGEWAARNGIANEQFPTAMRIDRVRVYEKQS
jgi:beta-glucanase (GH16 family)